MTEPVFVLTISGSAEVIPGDPPEQETETSVDTNDEGDAPWPSA